MASKSSTNIKELVIIPKAMLLSLSIINFIIIDNVTLDFAPGFTVITGETGAGKSIILDALKYLFGERLDLKYAKNPQQDTQITAEFKIKHSEAVIALLEQHSISAQDTIIIRRVISNNKSKIFIEDVMCTANLAKQLGMLLIEIIGQHSTLSILNPENHRQYLDEYSNAAAPSDILALVADSYKKWKESEKQLKALEDMIEASYIEKEYLEHSVHEIEALNIEAAEEDKLLEMRKNIKERQKITDIGQSITKDFNEHEGIFDRLASIIKALHKIDTLIPISDQINNIKMELEEAYSGLQDKLADATGNVNADELEERLHLIRGIARKHRIQGSQIPTFLAEMKAKLNILSHPEEQLVQCKKALELARDEYMTYALAVHNRRAKDALHLSRLIQTELVELKMEAVSIDIRVEKMQQQSWNKHGMDSILFTAKTNIDSAFAPINKIASGGELSRIMLAFKILMCKSQSPQTIVFDEVDIGVGGAVADSIGKKLALLADTTQVLSITHQPQVACYCNQHFLVKKAVENGKTKVMISALDTESQVQEISRMLSGEYITPEAMNAAKRMLKRVD